MGRANKTEILFGLRHHTYIRLAMNSIQTSDVPDSVLLARYANKGDDEAFDRLFARYRRLVFRASVAVLRDAEAAEDAVGATFLLLAKNAGRLSHRTSVAGWLCDTACFTAKNLRRMEDGQLKKLKRIGEELKMEQRTNNGDNDLLDEALAAMPAPARKVLLLKFAQGLTWPEVGEALHCSEGAARQRVQRALGQLSGLLSVSGTAITPQALEKAMANLDRPLQDPRPWLSRVSTDLVRHVMNSKRALRIKYGSAAFALGGLLLFIPPLVNPVATFSKRPGAAAPRPQTISQPVPAVTSSPVPALTKPFTLVYSENAKTEGLPDQNDTLTLSYDGKTLLLERKGVDNGHGTYTSLIQGQKLSIFMEGGRASGLPKELSGVPMTFQMDFDPFDSSKDEWLVRKSNTQAPPLTRWTPVTNIPPVGASLPNPTFRITLDGSYSWFMGDKKTTTRDAQGNLTHFGAYDASYDLSDYRPVGDVPVAGRVVVTRTEGDFRGPNTYTLKSASTEAFPAKKFKLATYQVGDLVSTKSTPGAFTTTTKVYVPKSVSREAKRKLGEFFAKNLP